MNTKILVFNTVTANGADVQTSSSMVTLTGAADGGSVTFNQKMLVAYAGRQVRVAGTNQVSTFTITAANNASYAIVIEATNKITGSPQNFPYAYVSDASATTAEICNAFVAAINADNRISVTASNVGDVLTLTGETPYFTFNGYNANPNGTTVVYAVTTPGVVGKWSGTLINNTNFASSDIVAANNYTAFIFTHENRIPRDADDLKREVQQVVVFVNEAATDYASLAGPLGTLTAALTGYATTWSAAAGTGSSVTNGVLTLGGADVFYGNSDTNVGLIAGDYILIGSVGYQLGSILTGTTAETATTPNDAATATTRYIQYRKF